MGQSSAIASQPLIDCNQALRIAHADAARVYGDLSAYSIRLALESDGWHIDFEFKDHRMKGGGPHYLLDSKTGAMLSKRYDQ